MCVGYGRYRCVGVVVMCVCVLLGGESKVVACVVCGWVVVP